MRKLASRIVGVSPILTRTGAAAIVLAMSLLIALSQQGVSADPDPPSVDVEAVSKDVFIGVEQVNLPDGDGDGLADASETLLGTDPGDWDSDDDGFPDGHEVNTGTNPLDDSSTPPADSDGDGLSDLLEGLMFTDDGDDDSDGDGFGDGDEFYSGSDPGDAGSTPPGPPSPDSDGDGLTDFQEGLLGTCASDPCPSGDARDSDGDGFEDGHEVGWGYNPLGDPSPPLDSDGDGLSDLLEAVIFTDAGNPDSDGDGFDDGHEINRGSDPLDDTSVPPPLLEIPAGEEVLFDVVEVISHDSTTDVPVWVNEDLNGNPDCTLSFHITPEFDALVRDLQFFSDGGDLFPDGDGVVTAPQGQHLGINFMTDVPAGGITLNELWDFTCEETSQHNFNLHKSVWPAEADEIDPSNNELQTQFEVIIFAEVDVQAVSKDVFIDGEQVNLPDSDGDGLADASETLIGTDPSDWDSDDDGFPDGHEVNAGTDPLDDSSTPPGDSDGDGLSDLLEGLMVTDDGNPDSDGDGFGDGEEFYNDSDPGDAGSIPPGPPPSDSDGDGLTDFQEGLLGTCASDPCPSGDARDSDGDGFEDGHEVGWGYNPLGGPNPPSDSDWDGLSDALEAVIFTDPNNWDSDGDGYGDGHEINRGSNPLDGGDVPPPIPQFPVGQLVLFEVVEVIRVDEETTPPGFSPVPVWVNENLNGSPDCTLSFRVTPEFDALVRDLQFFSGGGDLFPDGDGVVTAPQGQHLGINFMIDLLPGATTLNELWGFTCEETSQHNFNLNKNVNTGDQHIRDRDESNNNLGVNFEVGMDAGIAVALDRMKMTDHGSLRMEVGKSGNIKAQAWMDITCVTEGTFYIDVNVDASPQDEEDQQFDHDRSDNQLQGVIVVECVPPDDDD